MRKLCPVLVGFLLTLLIMLTAFKVPRVGPAHVQKGEEMDGWVFDEGHNLFVPYEPYDPRFVHDETGVVCYCKCNVEKSEKDKEP